MGMMCVAAVLDTPLIFLHNCDTMLCHSLCKKLGLCRNINTLRKVDLDELRCEK